MRTGAVARRLACDQRVQLVLTRTVIALQHLAISLWPVENQRLDYPVRCTTGPCATGDRHGPGPDTPGPR